MSEQTAKKEEDETAGSQEVNQELQKKEESSGQSALDAVGLGPAVGIELTEENFKKTCLELCRKFLDEKGGPTQYLTRELGGSPNDKWIDFAKALETAFPKRPDLVYLPNTQIPRNDETFQVSLWDLGWVKSCSTKPPTFKVTSQQLLDEYLTNSFLTKYEPLFLYQSDISGFKPDNSTGPLFWIHYVKGAARATSVLMLAHVCLVKLNADLVVLSPKLYETLLSVSCLLGTPATDASSIALENARRSSRGSIRKTHDSITWLAKLNTLTQ